MRYAKRILIISLLLLFILPFFITAKADLVYLKNGRRITGDIFSETESQISIKTVLGRMVVKKKDIAKIQREEQEVTHVRNGDYHMTRNEFNLAINEYEAAARLAPYNPEISTKLSEAKRKAAEALSASMAPDFAKADDLLAKGYYESAIKEYKLVPKLKNDDAQFTAEADAKIRNTANVMMTRASELFSQQDYNKAFEVYSQATTFLSDELVKDAKQKFDESLANFFMEADQALKNKQYSKAIAEYNKLQYTYPGDAVRSAIKTRTDGIDMEMSYETNTTSATNYILRAQFNADPMMVSNMGNAPGVFQQMEFVLDNTYRVDSLDEGGNINLEMTVNSANATQIALTGQKQNFPFPSIKNKKVMGSTNVQGKFAKPLDFGKILYNKGINGDRLDQNAFIGVIGSICRLPVVKSGKFKVADEWVETLNEKRSVGPLELITSGQIIYKFAGFETVASRDCMKLSMDCKYNSSLKGTMAGAEGQQQNLNLTFDTPVTGYAYVDYNDKILVRYSVNGNITLKGSVLGITAIQGQPQGGGMRPGMGPGMGPEGMPMDMPGKGGPMRPDFGGVATPAQTQYQTQQNMIPDINIGVSIDQNLVAYTLDTSAAQPTVPSVPANAADTTGATVAPAGNTPVDANTTTPNMTAPEATTTTPETGTEATKNN